MTKKIMVVGTSGSGKSTLARTLSQTLAIPHIELDTIYWQKNWLVNPDFRTILEQQLNIPEWIICGNYSKVDDLTWSHATVVLWLDYPMHVILWRAFKRSVQCIYTKEKICGDNIETIKRLFSKNSILLWVIQTYFKRRKKYQARIGQKATLPLMIRIKSPRKLAEIISVLPIIFQKAEDIEMLKLLNNTN